MIFGGPKLFTNDGDLGRHITIGNYILDTRTIPVHDIFSNTLPGQRLVPHEWLAEVIFALAHRVMGLSGDVLIDGVDEVPRRRAAEHWPFLADLNGGLHLVVGRRGVQRCYPR